MFDRFFELGEARGLRQEMEVFTRHSKVGLAAAHGTLVS